MNSLWMRPAVLLLVVVALPGACGSEPSDEPADTTAADIATDTAQETAGDATETADAYADSAVDASDVSDACPGCSACGNVLCEKGETAADCPEDCGGATACGADYVLVATAAGNICAPDFPVWGVRTDPNEYLLDNVDGTVSDSMTGLQWQKEYQDQVTWPQAVDACKALALGGFSDWRLPTMAEFEGLIDFEVVAPAIADPFQGMPGSDGTFFWSAVKYGGSSSKYWGVDFNEGRVWGWPITTLRRSRCVRNETASPLPPAQRFLVDEAAATVLDQATKLAWQRSESGPMSWAAAKTFCDAVPGWRLPHVIELRSLVDRIQKPGAIDPAAFPSTPAGNFWTRNAGYGSTAWFVNFDIGSSAVNAASGAYYVRCVK
jgi:hypothetical protein